MQAMSEIYNWGMKDLNIPEAHKHTLGENIKIGIIDSGESKHFDVAENVVSARNFSDSRYVEDKAGHSTFISGIIAAGKNGEGIIGVAPKSKLYFAKALDDSGVGNPAGMARAVKWCIRQKVDIISISAGMFFDFKPLHAAIKQAYARNIIVIAASGNTGSRNYDVAFPARYPETIGVAAYDKDHKVASFSSRGINVTCAMPGVDIYSTWTENQYIRSKGTSFAAPFMSGICSLILAKHRSTKNSKTPCETPKQMMEHLQKYSVVLGDKKDTGFGTVDLSNLLTKDI